MSGAGGNATSHDPIRIEQGSQIENELPPVWGERRCRRSEANARSVRTTKKLVSQTRQHVAGRDRCREEQATPHGHDVADAEPVKGFDAGDDLILDVERKV